jgi:hypothetical protein
VLLLCVIVLAAAVDLEFTTNDPLLLERMSSWAEDDAYDDSHATADGDAAINEKFSVSPLESDSGMRTVCPEIPSASIAISLGTRAPPLFGGMDNIRSFRRSFRSSRRDTPSMAVLHVLGWFQPHFPIACSCQKPSCSSRQVISRTRLLT